MKKRILSVLITLVMLIGLVTVMSVSASAATSNEVHYAVVYDKTDDKIYLYLGNSAHVVADDEVVQYDCQGYFTEERGDCYGGTFNIVKVIIESPIAPTSCKRLFQGLSACEEIKGIEKLDTSRATSMEDMFASCFKLYNPNVSGFDTSNVTDMSGMFASCKAITKLDLSNFDTSKVTDMSKMFVACHGLATELNLSSFIIGENTNTQDMFLYCNPVNTIKTPKINEKADIELPKGDYTPYALYGSVAGTEGSNMMPVTDGASITIGRQVIATLDNNGIGIPDMPETKTVFLGIPYGELPTTKETKEGYTFYWTTELGVNQGANLISNDTKVVNAINHKIYACWEPNKYTVTVDANDGNTAPTTIEVKYNGYYYNLPKVTREGYAFIGWYTEAEGGDKINTSKCTIAANHTIYAHWAASCTVSFDGNSGDVDTTSKTVVPGETYGTLPTPTRTGYKFVGWYTAKSGGDKVTESTTVTETKDHTLYAQWEARTYWIYLYNNHSNTDTSHAVGMTVTHGKTFGENSWRKGYLPSVSRTGYTFVGWFTAREGGTEITANSIVTGSDDLYAHWRLATYSVTFYNEGHGTAPDKQYVTYGNKATKPEDPTEEGWIFGGWYPNRSFKTEFDFDTIISDYTYLYAKWTPAHTHSYTYTASGNVITEACTCGHEETATINAPTGNLTYDGTEKVATVAYSEGWLGGELTVSYEPGNVEAGAVTASITMGDATATVAFTIEKSTYTVTFIVNGGEISDDDVISNYTYGIGATLPIPTREGYTFLGWYADEEYSGEAVTAIGATDTGDKTFYAKWEETVARYDVWVGGVQVTSANKDNIVVPGATGLATYNPETNTLTLNNFSYTGEGYEYDSNSACAAIYFNPADENAELTIELVGTNTVIIDNSECTSDAIYIANGNLIIKGNGSLTATGHTGIYAWGNISISGENTSVIATGNYGIQTNGGDIDIDGGKVEANVFYNGIVADGNISISSGEVRATATYEYGTGIYAEGNIDIDGGKVEANGGYEGIYSSGNIDIDGDKVDATGSLDYGIYADGTLTINGGIVTVKGSEAGIYVENNITIDSGTVKATASGDYGIGIVASAVTVNGGTVEVISTGEHGYGITTHDGVSCNGDFDVYAGESAPGELVTSPTTSTYNSKYVKITPVPPHTNHCICGETHASVGDHTTEQSVEWNAWNGTDTIAYTDGVAYVYLSADAERDSTLTVESDNTLYLCLNGNTLSRTSGFTGRAIEVYSGATFVLTDCGTTGAISGFQTASNGAGVYNSGTFTMYGGTISNNELTGGSGAGIYNNGTFTMYGGAISNNKSARYAGGVHNYGTFNMFGGSITGNTATWSGGGVETNGTFNMSGGSITGNTAGYGGGGIHIPPESGGDGVFNVSGNVQISGNTPCNVYLDTDKFFTVTGNLTGDSNIGVTMNDDIGCFAKIDIDGATSNQISAILAKFYSEDGYPTYNKGTLLCIGDHITEEPTATNNYKVTVTNAESATYQWCSTSSSTMTVVEGAEVMPMSLEATADNQIKTSSVWMGTFNKSNGTWTTEYYQEEGEEPFYILDIELFARKGDVVKFTPVGDVSEVDIIVEVYNGPEFDYDPNAGVYTYTITESGDFNPMAIANAEVSFKIEIVRTTLTPLDGQTSATLDTTNLPTGTYACKVTWKIGTDAVFYNYTLTSAAVAYPTYTVTATSTTGGTVTGGGNYSYGETVTLTATPNNGYNFVNWTQNGSVVSTDATYTFTATESAEYVANFVETQTHCICGKTHASVGDHTTEQSVEWNAWDGTSAITYDSNNTAYVYLYADAERSSTLEIPTGYTLYLCLNGKKLSYAGSGNVSIFTVAENATLNITDCGTTARPGYVEVDDDGDTLLWHEGSGDGADDITYNLTGGLITGGTGTVISGTTRLGGAVYAQTGATVNLYGGNIAGNSAHYGGGIYGEGCTMNIYGGSIVGNTVGGIELDSNNSDQANIIDSNLNIHGGNIKYNRHNGYSPSEVGVTGTITMTGGTVIAESTQIAIVGGAGFTMSGGTVINNAQDGFAVLVQDTGAELSGGTISAPNNGTAVYILIAPPNGHYGGDILLSGEPVLEGAVADITVCTAKVNGVGIDLQNHIVLKGPLTGSTPYTVGVYLITLDDSSTELDENPTIDFTKGWSTHMGNADPAKYFINANTAEDAKQIALINGELWLATTYTVSVSASPTAGGTVTGGGTYQVGATVTLTATPNNGYNFVNWTQNGSVVSTDATYTFIANESAEYVATFQQNTPSAPPAPSHVSVTLVYGNGIESETKRLPVDTGAPAAPAVNGKAFAGWYDDAACTQAHDFSTPFTADDTLYARYVEISERSRVSFVADGRLVGIILYRPSQTELTTVPKVPAKEGYVGTWETYTLNGKNMVVRAVYTKE